MEIGRLTYSNEEAAFNHSVQVFGRQSLNNAERAQNSVDELTRFQLLVESVIDYAIYMLDENGIVASWNRGAQRFKGYEASEIIGHHFSEFYTDEDRRAGLPTRNLENAIREGRFESEGWRVRKDGSSFWAHVVIDTIREPSGRLVGFAKITRDITERKRLEAELVQASKMATLGTLSAGIAHELNQPLNVIRIWAENGLRILRAGSPDLARLERTLTLAIDQAKRMAAIIEHIRTLSRPAPSTLGDFNPAESVRAAVAIVAQQYAVEGIAVELDLPARALEAHGTGVHLEQVVLALLSNARDAITARRQEQPDIVGVIWIRVTFDGASLCATIQVMDNGGGISNDILDRVFDPFFTTKEVGQGTGLGLSVSYSIMQRMGGSLEAANSWAPDGNPGAVFTARLPARPMRPGPSG